MKKWMRYAIMIVLLGFFVRSYGQDSTRVRPNQFKVDLMGLYYPVSWYNGGNRTRLSAEYERPLSQTQHWSWTVDFEIGRRHYEFRRFWEWEGYDPPIMPRYLNGWTTQKDYSLLLGIRYSLQWGGQAKRFKAFMEPQIGGVLRHAKLFHENPGLPIIVENKIDFNPRLRAGLAWSFHRRWGIEGLADLYRYQRLGDGRTNWGVFPELNLRFSF